MPKKNAAVIALEAVTPFVIGVLPDSMKKRKDILAALANGLPKNSELKQRVMEMQMHLEIHEKLQNDLPGLFESKPTSRDGNGNGKGNGA